MSKRNTILLIAGSVGLVIVLAGLAFWWFSGGRNQVGETSSSPRREVAGASASYHRNSRADLWRCRRNRDTWVCANPSDRGYFSSETREHEAGFTAQYGGIT